MSVALAEDLPLPPIREDLQISRGGASYSGAPTWVVFDPVRNRFFRVTYEMFQLLSLWNASRMASTLIKAVENRFGSQLGLEDIGTVMRMLDHNLFLTQPLSGSWRSLHHRATPHHSIFGRLIHGYLFFRIPLVRPHKFIRATWPHISFLFTRGFAWIILIAGLLGIYLVSRQWEAFLATFPFVFSAEGAVISVLSIVFIKCMHELGHAYVAHRFGCRVPTMGVAFLVMVPMLYTDVSDAWKLKSRWARLRIDTAGVMVELCVAAFALVLWAFIPDGSFRSAIFVLAATSWVMSLLVNLSPFTRFDGYYVLSDLLGVENLQPRAFKHMRWRLRQTLFDPGHPAPEAFPPRLDAILTIYAIATAIYRLILYTGIALLVYHFTIKLVGIMLFAIEIGFFMIRPVWSEVREWFSMRHDIIRSRRSYVSAAIFLFAVTLAFLPLDTHVQAPAIMIPRQFARLYPQEAGRVEKIAIERGQSVKAGDTLFVIDTPAIGEELRVVAVEIELARLRLARIGANSDDLADRSILQRQVASLTAKQKGLEERQDKLVVRAPFDGTITDLNPELLPGQWISRQEQLAFLSSGSDFIIRGYVSGDDSSRITDGATGWFIANDMTLPRIPVSLAQIADSGAQEIEVPQLTSQFQGAIAVRPIASGHKQLLVPVDAQYAITAHAAGAVDPPMQSLAGVMRIDGKGQSVAERVWRQVLRVVLREANA